MLATFKTSLTSANLFPATPRVTSSQHLRIKSPRLGIVILWLQKKWLNASGFGSMLSLNKARSSKRQMLQFNPEMESHI